MLKRINIETPKDDKSPQIITYKPRKNEILKGLYFVCFAEPNCYPFVNHWAKLSVIIKKEVVLSDVPPALAKSKNKYFSIDRKINEPIKLAIRSNDNAKISLLLDLETIKEAENE